MRKETFGQKFGFLIAVALFLLVAIAVFIGGACIVATEAFGRFTLNAHHGWVEAACHSMVWTFFLTLFGNGLVDAVWGYDYERRDEKRKGAFGNMMHGVWNFWRALSDWLAWSISFIVIPALLFVIQVLIIRAW